MSPYWTVWSTALLFFGGFYALLVTIPLYLEAVGLPDWQIGFALGALGVSFGALFAFLPLLAERRELASVGAAYGV